ncbi:kinase-like domain-containing protein [Dichotomocladium elegans]|nr:kinase-like domain-containing protein [Dichotomocladium elegans]
MRKRLERRFSRSSTTDRPAVPPPPLPQEPPPLADLSISQPSEQLQRSRRKSWCGVFGSRRDKSIRHTRKIAPDSSSRFMSPPAAGVAYTFPVSTFMLPPKSQLSPAPTVSYIENSYPHLLPPTEEEKDIPPPLSARDRSTIIKPLLALTVHLPDTYTRRNPKFRYDPSRNPRRALTKPSIGCKNHKYDNANSDYIIYVNDILGDESSTGRRYIVQEMLGSGTFGQVVKCRVMGTSNTVGIKVIKNKPAYLKQSLIEVDILKHLNAVGDPKNKKHILRLLDTFTHKHHLCLVFELLSINLYELLKQNKFRGLSTNLIRMFSAQILDVLIVLQDAGVIHCDLKPENILLENLEAPSIKVIDFGSACHKSQKMYTYIQSRFYRSPEVILGMRYSSSIDMWSFGCIVAELFLGLPLFPGSSEYNQLSRIIDTLGLPPAYMIDQGRHAYRFFNRIEWQGRVCYELKSLKQYMHEQNVNEKPSKKYFSTTNLAELILKHPMPRKHITEAEKEKEMRLRETMLDFLQKVLQIDPLQRLTPREAKRHPFIAGSGETAVDTSSCKALDAKDPANCCICSVSSNGDGISHPPGYSRSKVAMEEKLIFSHATEANPTLGTVDDQQEQQQPQAHSISSDKADSKVMNPMNMMGTPPLSPAGMKFRETATSGLSTANDVTQQKNSDSEHAAVAFTVPDTTRSECHLRRRSQATQI